jgi:hypothetical protein
MRYKANIGGLRTSQGFCKLAIRAVAGGTEVMTHVARPRAFARPLLGIVTYLALGSVFAAGEGASGAQVEPRQLIARETCTGAGLAKLTALPSEPQSTATTAPSAKDRSQWRKLRRRMSKDEVRNLLGEPDRISVSRFYESWYYGGGSVTFDGKGRVDLWSEP